MGKTIKLFCAAMALSVSHVAAADSYPDKSLRLIVPYPPGGITDIVGRTIAERMSRDLGQPIVVENRAGAGGTIGASEAARARPDGYTLFLGTSATHGTNPSTYAQLSYDAEKDFDPIAWVAWAPLMIIVKPQLQVTNIGEFIEYAKQRPGELAYASTGTGGSVHLTTELFGMETGVKMNHVPYKGSSPALTDLMGGHIDVMFDNVPSAAPLAESGKVRGLAVTGAARSVLAPEVPTVDETVVPGFDSTSWIALYAPKGTPLEAIEKLSASVNKALKDPGLLETFEKAGLTARGGKPAELAEHQATEIKKWAEVVDAIGYEPS